MNALDIRGTSNAEAALAGLAKAVDRVRALETEADCAFADIAAAQARCAEVKLAIDVQLNPGMAAAFSAYKQGKAAEQGREIARQDHGWPLQESA